MPEPCSLCDDSGMRIVERPDGTRVAQPCACRLRRRAERMREAARIPERYVHCTLENYDVRLQQGNRSIMAALVQARNFVKAYPLETYGNGLLLTGPVGVGKTHLAVGMLQELITQRGARGLFYDYRDLLKQVQNSYNQSVNTTELEVLQPVFDADVLVLDELGANKRTDWVWDTVAHILNTRYNDRRTTIITTNYANLPPGGPEVDRERTFARDETLGDRIGERMRSRLQEMCVILDVNGDDLRRSTKRANFGVSAAVTENEGVSGGSVAHVLARRRSRRAM